MGFEIPRRFAILEFDEPYKGAEIKARLDVDTATFFAIQKLQKSVTEDNEEDTRRALGFFLDHAAVSWNFEEDGVALPMSVDALMQLPAALTLAIIPKWIEAASGVPAPLDEVSPDTDPSVAA